MFSNQSQVAEPIMNGNGVPSLSLNACTSCKQSKRKCDRSRPICSTCARVGRSCHYEEDTHPIYRKSDSGTPLQSQSSRSRSEEGTMQSQGSNSQGQSPQTFFSFPATAIDPFRHDTLRQPTVNIAIITEAAKIFRSCDDIHLVARKYFDGIYQRLPIVSKVRFIDRIPHTFSRPRADFTVLCLCINLLVQFPSPHEQSMQSSQYVSIKNAISLLEAASIISVEVVQARLLMTFYEMGHNIHPGASISIATAARTARLLGLNKKRFQNPAEDLGSKIIAEEEKRVWWAVVNLDRFINLCNGDSLFTTEDPKASDHLPIDDVAWSRNDTGSITLSTPSDIRVGQLARECQMSHLTGRVLRHVYDPTPDAEFHAQEALQLERTLVAFMPLLLEEHTKYGMYCAALGMCSNALFTMYDATLMAHQNDFDPTYRNSILASLEETSIRITEFSAHLFGDPETVNYDTASPYVPYSIYHAAIVQYRLWKQTGSERHKAALDSLKNVLKYLNRRWLISGAYLNAIENLDIDFPSTITPLHGAFVSATGPSG